jgi:multidrug resistance efflux pump
MLRFEVAGRLVSVAVKDGDRVRQGDVLARIDSTTQMCELAKAEAGLALAKAERERLINGARKETRAFARAQYHAAQARMSQAAKRLERAVQLQQHNGLSRQELDDLTTAAQESQAEVEAASARADEAEAPARHDDLNIVLAKIELEEARVKQAHAMLEKTELKAPFDGVVLRVRGEVGELAPHGDVPTITMANVSEMRVRAYVEEMDALSVTEGQRGHVISDSSAGVRFPVTVISCTPYMAPKRLFSNMPGERMDVKVREVVLRLDEQNDLVVGLPVDVFIGCESEFGSEILTLRTAAVAGPGGVAPR